MKATRATLVELPAEGLEALAPGRRDAQSLHRAGRSGEMNESPAGLGAEERAAASMLG
jgi:hypothetical protein